MTTTLTYVNEDGFEMDGTCVPVRLTDAAIDMMAEQRSEWWVEVGRELFTEPLRKQGKSVEVSTIELVGIRDEIEFLIALWEGEDWDADWTMPSERQQYRFAWQQRGRSLKVNRDRLDALIARCKEMAA
tara:strand:+ start:196 stop:582 length:387 start_codon:yes stop_codon:yes gene_type:complete